MIKQDRAVFLFAGEDKDSYCLEPLADELRKRFTRVYDLSGTLELRCSTPPVRSVLQGFCSEERPLVLLCSPYVGSFLEILRSRESYDCIGIEHGIAPFKRHTFGQHLLASDYYIAPTRLWADRLKRLYPEQAHRIEVGGFPRLEILRELRVKAMNSVEASPAGIGHWLQAEGVRKLVILSWGTDPAELDRLPDTPNIAYLYHPGDKKGMLGRTSTRSSLFLSTPELSSCLLANADEVYGDFSSLSLEAVTLGIPTRIFIDRRLYTSNCDLPPEFFDRRSPDFAMIPEAGERIPPELALSLEALSNFLAGDGGSAPPLTVDALPPGILPPSGVDNRKVTADAIHKISANMPQNTPVRAHLDQNGVDALLFLLSAYSDVLGRTSDLKGLRHYLIRLISSASSPPLAGLSILREFAHSAEGRARFEQGRWGWPQISFEPSSSNLTARGKAE